MIESLGRLSPALQRVFLVACGILLFMVWFSRVPLTEIDEVRYAEATRQMVSTGNYLIPQFNGHPRYQKPILYYWIQSIPVRVLGASEPAARLPSALIAIALLLLLHAFLLRWLVPRVPAGDARALVRARGCAFLGAVLLAVMPLITIWARAATTDLTLTFFISAALLALLQADLVRATGGEEASTLRRIHGWYLAAAAAAALAFLTKGPVGLVLPVLAWLLYHLKQRDLTAEVRRVPWAPVLLLFLLIAAPWYVATWIVDGPGFVTQFFLTENIGRFSAVQEGHGAGNRLLGLVLYLPIALVALFPGSPFLVRDLLAPFAGHDEVLCRLRRFAWAWFWAVLGFFALSKTQLPSYIQSVAPAAAILVTVHLLGRLESASSGRRILPGKWLELTLLLLISGSYLAAGLVVLLGGKMSGPLGDAALAQPQATVLAGLLAMVGVLYLISLAPACLRGDSGRLLPRTVAGWGLVMAVLMLGVAPLLISAGYRESVELGRYLQQFPATVPIVANNRLFSEDLVYYSHRTIHWYPQGDERFAALLQQLAAQQRDVIILTDADGVKWLQPLGEPALLRRSEHILVIRKNNQALMNP